MSRENPHVNETVDGTLTGTKNYNVKIIVTAREAWGRNTVPDNYLPEGEELSPMSGMAVADGVYVLRYEFNNRHYQSKVRVGDGSFRTP